MALLAGGERAPVQLVDNTFLVDLPRTKLPARLVGRVRSDVVAVRIRFADGTTTTLRPTRGYVLYAAPREHLSAATGAVAAEGLRRDGSVVARLSFVPPKPSRAVGGHVR